jgi:ABC-type multidrug transport system fused ATPase/permease subunit
VPMMKKLRQGLGTSLGKVFLELLGHFRTEYNGLVAVSVLLSMADGILHPLLVKSIFDEIVGRRGVKQFLVLVVAYLALGLVVSLGSAATALWGKSLENRIVKQVSGRLLRSYYEKEYASILKNGHGYFINRIHGDVNEGLVPLLALVQLTIKQGVLLLSLSLVLIYLSWKAFLILTVLIPISATVGALLGKKIKTLTSQEREQEGAVLAALTKLLNSFRMVKGFHLLDKAVCAFDERLANYLATKYQRFRVTRRFQATIDLTMVVSDFLSMLVGALFVLRGTLTFGSYFAFINAFWRAVTTLMQIFKSAPDFHNLGVIATRLASFLSETAGLYHRIGRSTSVSHIDFSYADTLILHDFSLELLPGEKVVIVGPNGSGKTTLAHILSGYLPPTRGETVLPQRISSVTLPIFFPPLKVRDLVSDTGLLSKFRLADPELLVAPADELSAGQQQKLALALALSQDAELYVIDEPLANLDSESRNIAMNLIFERTKTKTLVLIMHGSEEYHRLFDKVIRIDAVKQNDTVSQAVTLDV